MIAASVRRPFWLVVSSRTVRRHPRPRTVRVL